MVMIMLLFGVMFLSGCDTPSKTSSAGNSLDLSVASMTSQVYENNPMTIVLELRNKGKFSIKGGRLTISGFDSELFPGGFHGEQGTSFSNNQGSFDLDGRTDYNHEGGYKLMTISANTAQLPTDMPYNPTLLITACYDYETNAAAEICLDTSPYSAKVKTNVCTPGTVNLPSDQGAPVTISSISIEPNQNFAYIKFHITAQGDIFDSSEISNCNNGIAREKYGVVKLKNVYVGSTSLTECMNVQNGNIRLINGVGTFWCKYNFPNEKGVFLKPLVVQLEYGAMSTLKEPVTIKKMSK